MSPSPVDVVSHTRPAATTGDDQPSPGTGVFQSMFRYSVHSTGRFVSVEWPWPVGPRNCGHSWAVAVVATPRSAAKTRRLIRAAIRRFAADIDRLEPGVAPLHHEHAEALLHPRLDVGG